MKKKLKIDQLRVQSFVTTVNDVVIGGSRSELCGLSEYVCGTNASCLDYISCNEIQCVLNSRAEPCVQDAVRTGPVICR
jgi:hypothetical protein